MESQLKAIGFNAGQYGDIAMGMVAIQQFKKQYPNSHFTLGIGDRYKDCGNVFRANPYIDDIHIWSSYNDWPVSKDLTYLRNQQFNKIFDAMPQHTQPDWYMHRHQTEELCLMHGLDKPTNTQIELFHFWGGANTGRYLCSQRTICFALGSSMEDKKYDFTQSELLGLLDLLNSKNFMPIFLCDASSNLRYQIITDIDLYGKCRVIGSPSFDYAECIRMIADTELLISVDTGFIWYASGFKIPTIGLYGWSHYPGATTSKNWQPTNPNATYIEKYKAQEITYKEILNAICQKLNL